MEATPPSLPKEILLAQGSFVRDKATSGAVGHPLLAALSPASCSPPPTHAE